MTQSPSVGLETTNAGASAPAVYQVRNLQKAFARQAVTALENVSFDLPRGSFTSVIGASGCGKSTLLKIMAGLVSPTAGSVMLAGSPVLGTRPDIGMMFQQAVLLPWMTTIENILQPIEIRHGKAAARAQRSNAEALMELVGLQGFENAYPKELSGGMQQRASICRMLITEPQILLLDEPFSALDELVRDHMNMELQRICMARNATTFLITHSIPEAVLLSDKVFVMGARPGRIMEEVIIDLPRPRTLEMMLDPHFGELVAYIRNRLDIGVNHGK
ncbi:ABC transporter ATP-binding protein [Devosia sp. WQ 349]|uniref:ABC transporter ATP-binding protein n=1 Tax=Devosia sp. WQ 349K1 TaxID=2800329 RepID=UPI001907FFB9|nr:ABC transporter ATP-binding protein [Devosia sp. WQ 349K1]MBK1796120.1 ABC transporter ATP-binding protein [Devosia sp. WQ 349K1]